MLREYDTSELLGQPPHECNQNLQRRFRTWPFNQNIWKLCSSIRTWFFSTWRLYSTLWSELDQIPKPCLYNLLQTYDQQLAQPTPASHDYTKLAYKNCNEKEKEQDAKTGSNHICFFPKVTTNSSINTCLHHTFKGLEAGFWRGRLAKNREKEVVKPS